MLLCCGLLSGFLHVLAHGLDGFAGGFGRVFRAIPHAFGHIFDPGCGVLHGAPSSLGHALHALTDGLGAFAHRGGGCFGRSGRAFGDSLRTLTDCFAGCLGRIPRAFGHRLGAFGRRLHSLTGFFDRLLRVALGLITSGQAESGRRYNKEIRFHSPANVEIGAKRGKHIFAKFHRGDGNYTLPRRLRVDWLLR